MLCSPFSPLASSFLAPFFVAGSVLFCSVLACLPVCLLVCLLTHPGRLFVRLFMSVLPRIHGFAAVSFSLSLFVEFTGLDWIGLDWIGLDWIGQGRGMGSELGRFDLI
jgi:hypothetical protein